MSGSLYARALTVDPETGMTAEDWDPVRQGLTNWVQAQQRKSYDMGLADPNTGLPTSAGMTRIGPLYAGALIGGTSAPGAIRAFHGSPHDFERFDIGKIGTGEGAQAYGQGLYFAEAEPTAQSYRTAGAGAPSGPYSYWLQRAGGDWGKALSDFNTWVSDMGHPPTAAQAETRAVLERGAQPGHMYEVNINADPEQMLHWDKPLKEQPEAVQQLGVNAPWTVKTGGDLVTHLQRKNGPAETAQMLQDAGIPGIRYLDAGSRSAGEGSHNYVMFDPETIDILRKYGIAGLGIGGAGGAAALDTGDQQQ